MDVSTADDVLDLWHAETARAAAIQRNERGEARLLQAIGSVGASVEELDRQRA